jgi:hypothetical protein
MRISMIALALLAGCASPDAKDSPSPKVPMTAAAEQHVWLRQLVGDWAISSEATMEPGGEPWHMDSTERVRAIGDLWVLGEGSASLDGAPFSTVLTLGYNPAKGVFVGTWIDSMTAHMWHYEGTLDSEKRVLTLDTTGPSFGDPSKTARYRDAIELKGPRERTLTSSVLGDDGTWTTFMRAKYTRKR